MEAMKRILSKPPKDRTPKTMQFLINFTKEIKFFNELGDEAHYQCCQYMTYHYAEEGDVILTQFLFHKGDAGSQFFVILSGKCGVLVPTEDGAIDFTEVLVYNTGDSFGELAVMKNQPRAASILCKTDCHFGVLDRADFLRIIGKIKEIKLIRKVDFLQKLGLFQRWTKGSLIKLSYYFKERTYRRKQTVYSAGDEATEIYFISKGEFQLMQTVHIPSSLNALHKQRGAISLLAEVTVLSTDQFFGEDDVLDNSARRFTCMCRSESAEVFILSKDVPLTQDFTKRIAINEETINFIRKIKTTKANFRQERLKAITTLEALKKQETLIGTVSVQGSTDASPRLKSLSKQVSSRLHLESLSTALRKLDRDQKPSRNSDSPMCDFAPKLSLCTASGSPEPRVDPARTDRKHTWDEFLAQKMGDDRRTPQHARARSDKVVNIHTQKLKRHTKTGDPSKFEPFRLARDLRRTASDVFGGCVGVPVGLRVTGLVSQSRQSVQRDGFFTQR